MSDVEMFLAFHVFVFAALWVSALVELYGTRRLVKSQTRLIAAQNRRNDSQQKLIATQGSLIAVLRRSRDIELNRSLRFEAIARRN